VIKMPSSYEKNLEVIAANKALEEKKKATKKPKASPKKTPAKEVKSKLAE
tara:strand:+ start:1542 stop:1691 length:150 start_codon:yes stop_codon:yes gene_type:complete